MLIKEIEKNKTEKICIEVTVYNGHPLVNCRVYWKNINGEWFPGKKGLALTQKTIQGVIEGLETAARELEQL